MLEPWKEVTTLEGGDDPGRVFIKRESVRALVCALSLLNLKGCSDESPMEHGWNLSFSLRFLVL